MTVLSQSLSVSSGFATQLFCDLMQVAEMVPWWATEACALLEEKTLPSSMPSLTWDYIAWELSYWYSPRPALNILLAKTTNFPARAEQTEVNVNGVVQRKKGSRHWQGPLWSRRLVMADYLAMQCQNRICCQGLFCCKVTTHFTAQNHSLVFALVHTLGRGNGINSDTQKVLERKVFN